MPGSTPGVNGSESSTARGRRRGQAIVEITLVAPVLMLLMLGGYDIAMLMADRVVAANAVRHGARLAAALGGTKTNPGALTPDIDQKIVRDVLAVAGGMNYATLVEIDIYQPSRADGVYQAGDAINQYNGSGTSLGGSPAFTLAMRNQVPPTETSIGVRLIWNYKPPTGWGSATIQLTDYAVMKAQPVLI